MNSPRLFFDLYKIYANYKDVENLVVLEFNTTGKLSSQMWTQIFKHIHVETDITKLNSYEFDIFFLNIEDWSTAEKILCSLNYSPRHRGYHEVVVSNKEKFWEYFLPKPVGDICPDGIFQRAKLWGGEEDKRQFHVQGDIGLFPYKIKRPDQTVIAESVENESTIFQYR
jgi:hypothetical protein